MAVELEGLSYEIEAQTGDAVKQLDTLASSLEKLKAASGGLKLGRVSNQLKKLSEAVSGIDVKSIMKLRQLSEGLGKLASAGDIRISKSLGNNIANIGKGMDSVTDEKIDRISRLADALKKLGDVGPVKIPGIKNLDKATEATTATVKYAPSTDVNTAHQEEEAVSSKPYTVDFDTAYKQWTDAQYELTGAGKAAIGVYNTMSGAINTVGNAFKAAGPAVKMFGNYLANTAVPASAEFGKNVVLGFAKMPLMFGGRVLGGIKSMVSGLGGIFSGLMRIAKFRAYRTIIKLFTEGLKEGLDNLYYYSQLAGTNFAGALDSIATSANYVKNSLGAMASPLIEAVAPAIDFIADKIVALFNLINQLFSRLTGKSTYTAAKKITATYKGAADSAGKGASDAAKKASDELKKTILGFDEINKLNDPNKSSGSGGGGGGGTGGGGGGYGDMFEELPIEDGIANFADRIKALINAGDWDGLGRLFGEKVNQIFDLGGGDAAKLKWEGWGHKVAGYINNAIDIAYGFLDETKFDNIGKRIAQFMNGLFDKNGGINSYKLGYTLSLGFTDALDLLLGFVKEFDTEDFGNSINELMTGFYDHFSTWVNGSDKDWEKLGNTLEEKIKLFVFGLDSDEIAGSGEKAMDGAINAIVKTAKGFLESAFKDFEKWVNKKWDEVGLGGVLEIILQKMGDGAMSTNPLQWIWTHLLDPMIGAIVGEENWEDCKKGGENIVNKMVEGLRTAFDPLGWVKKNIIDPIIRELTDGDNWVMKPFDFLGKLFGGEGGNGGSGRGIEVPLTPKVENNSRSWLSDIESWWGKLFGGDHNKQEFRSQPKEDTKKWPTLISDWWSDKFGGKKNTQSFTTEPDKKGTSGWLGSIQTWWNEKFGGKKNTQKFNAEGDATALHDKIPQAQKKFNTMANFNTGTDSLPVNKKTFNSTANFKVGLDGLSDKDKKFSSVANFTSRTNSLSDSDKKFNTVANFDSRKNSLSDDEKKFSTVANFDSRKNSLSSEEKKINMTAKITDVIKPKYKPEIIVTGKIKSVHYSGGGRLTMAKGGVFTGNGVKPIQRYATGGLPTGTQLFWARERGPELVGTLGSHTAVMNNDQIVASVSAGVARAISGIHFQLQGMQTPEPMPIDQYVSAPEPARTDANAEMLTEARQQNALLRRQNDLLQRLLDKESTVEVTTKQFASAANRQNRREGRTTIAVSAT